MWWPYLANTVSWSAYNMDRFWSKVRKAGPDDCWLWTGARSKRQGYGRVGYKGKVMGAHQVSYILAHPEEPMPNFKVHPVMHSCDVRHCVNPRHLSLGTVLENNEEAAHKGRLGGGGVKKAHGNAKLTWARVRNMRLNYLGRRGELKYLYTKFGVSKYTIIALLKGRTWKKKEE